MGPFRIRLNKNLGLDVTEFPECPSKYVLHFVSEMPATELTTPNLCGNVSCPRLYYISLQYLVRPKLYERRRVAIMSLPMWSMTLDRQRPISFAFCGWSSTHLMNRNQ